MQRLTNIFTVTDQFVLNYVNLQQIRYARKPIWMGTAKSKLFRIPPRPKIPAEESEEIKRLFNNYRTYMKSINAYLTEKYCVDNMSSLDPELIRKAFEVDLVKCQELNDKWNEKQKIIREKRVSEELVGEIDFAKRRIAEELLKKQRELEEVEEIVRREKENAKSFITPDKLDEAIEFALANPTDYDFAIDLEENRIMGKETVKDKSHDS